MSKFPNPFGKPKKIGTPTPEPMTPEQSKGHQDGAMALQKFLAKAPPGVVKKAPTPTPAGGFKPGMSGQQAEAGEVLKDYNAMRPKMATRDKILNPVKKAVGLPGKPAKMVPKKPGQK